MIVSVAPHPVGAPTIVEVAKAAGSDKVRGPSTFRGVPRCLHRPLPEGEDGADDGAVGHRGPPRYSRGRAKSHNMRISRNRRRRRPARKRLHEGPPAAEDPTCPSSRGAAGRRGASGVGTLAAYLRRRGTTGPARSCSAVCRPRSSGRSRLETRSVEPATSWRRSALTCASGFAPR